VNPLNLFSLDRFIALVILFFTSMPVHEWAHAWTAYQLGDDTAALSGRMTLNPLAHLDLYGTISYLVGFIGWGKPVPVSQHRLRGDMRASMALVGLAGPFSNLIMAMIAAIPFRFGWLIGYSEQMSFLRQVFEDVVTINLGLMLFNLIPVPPLDGSRILAWLLPRQLTYELERLERYGGIALIFVALFIARMPWFSAVLNFLFSLLRG
jgi:Zn-dependent protease